MPALLSGGRQCIGFTLSRMFVNSPVTLAVGSSQPTLGGLGRMSPTVPMGERQPSKVGGLLAAAVCWRVDLVDLLSWKKDTPTPRIKWVHPRPALVMSAATPSRQAPFTDVSSPRSLPAGPIGPVDPEPLPVSKASSPRPSARGRLAQPLAQTTYQSGG